MTPVEATSSARAPRPRTYWWLTSIAAPVIGLVLDALSGLLVRAEMLGWLALLVGAAAGLWMCLRSFRRREVLCLLSLVSGIPCLLIVAAAMVLLVSSLVYGTSARQF